jgi:hypothetical protein
MHSDGASDKDFPVRRMFISACVFGRITLIDSIGKSEGATLWSVTVSVKVTEAPGEVVVPVKAKAIPGNASDATIPNKITNFLILSCLKKG